MLTKIIKSAVVEQNVLFLSAQTEMSVEENFNISFSEASHY